MIRTLSGFNIDVACDKNWKGCGNRTRQIDCQCHFGEGDMLFSVFVTMAWENSELSVLKEEIAECNNLPL